MGRRRNGFIMLLGALLAPAALPASAAAEGSLVYGACDRGRQDNPAFAACLGTEMQRLAPLMERYAQAAKDSLRASAQEATAEGMLHEARAYGEALDQFDVAQGLWVQFREAHCTVQAKQVNGSGAATAPDACKVRLGYERLREIWRLVPTGLPHPPTSDGLAPPPGPFASRWPVRDLARFVFEHLDIASFRNSTGPRRRTGQRTFADLGIRPQRVSDSEAAADDEGWLYAVRILHRGDYNRDGVEEVLVCFRDAAQDEGSHDTAAPLVLQFIDGRAVALAHAEESRAQTAGCPGRR